MIALSCAAAFCAFAGSAFANWMTVIDYQPMTVGLPAGAPTEAPEHVEQLPSVLDQAGAERREPSMDLYGNEVTEAVAKYLLDSTGAVYEEHSPQTEVPRLAGPTS